jgi:hypothetical protein
VQKALTEPWNKGVVARNRMGCTERRRSHVFRQNCSQEFLPGYLAVHRVEFVASLADRAGRGGEVRADCGRDHRPGPGRMCLVDGTITPSCSYAEHDELWSHKHGTTVFNSQLVCLLDGAAIYISDPLPGCTHDAKGIRHHAGRRDCRALRGRDRG